MTGLHPGDQMLYSRPVPPYAARPLRRRCAAGILTILLLAALVLVFVQGTVVRAIRLVQPALLVKLDRDAPKPPPPKIPPPLIKPQATVIEPPQIIIAPDPIVPTPPAPAAMMSSPVPPPAPPAPAAASGVDLIAIARAYLIKVHDHLNLRLNCSTFAFRLNEEEGTATVHFVMTSDGTVLSESLTKSSGSPTLDKEALAVLLRAQPLPPIPPILHKDKLETNIPISCQNAGSVTAAFGFRR